MKKIETILKEELTELSLVVEKATQRLMDVPAGTLRVRNWNGKIDTTETAMPKTARKPGAMEDI